MKKTKQTRIESLMRSENYLLICLMIVVSIIPLLIRIIPIDYPIDNLPWYSGKQAFYDIFSAVKANAILLMGVLGILGLANYVYRQKHLGILKTPVVYLALLSMISAIISSILSPYPYFSFHGFLERYEDVWVIICYAIFFIIAYVISWDDKRYKWFFNAFWCSNIILSLIGFGQMTGHNIILNKAFLPLITSFKITQSFDIQDLFENLMVITQTLYHYNYVGFYIAMSFPIFATFALYEKNIKKRIALALTAFAILINLFASSARGGLVGILISSLFWLILNRHLIFKNIKITISVLCILLISFIGYEAYSGGYVIARLKQMVSFSKHEYQLQQITTTDDTIIMDVPEGTLKIIITGKENNDWNFHCTFNDLDVATKINEESKMYFLDDALKDIYIYYTVYNSSPNYHLTIEAEGFAWPFDYADIDHKLFYRNPYGNYVTLSEIDRVKALDGYEPVGSARIFIWSRLIPKIAERPIFGYGPDTAQVIFPQDDYLGKIHAYGTNNMIVDKAHNLYVQYAVSFGFLGLGTLLALIILFFIMSIRLLIRQQFKFESAVESALIIAVLSYLVAAFFNDSNVHVSPVFWVLFGMAFAYMKEKGSTKTQQ